MRHALPTAITETSIFLVAVPQPVTTVIGRVLESDGVTPVRGAIAIANGQQATTDGNGGFILRNVSVPVNTTMLTVEASFQRPSGRVDRKQSAATPVVLNSVTNVGPLVLPAPPANRPPVIIAPSSLEVTEGLVLNAAILAFDQDAGQTVRVSLAGPGFATLTASGNNFYTLRLAPPVGVARAYTLMITAIDDASPSPSASTVQPIQLTVNANRAPTLSAPALLFATPGQPLSFTISATDLDNTPPGLVTPQTFTFSSSNLPPGATLTPLSGGVSVRFDWTPTATGTITPSFTVSDNGTPALSDTKNVTVKVVQWEQTAGPEGGPVGALLSNGADLFAGGTGGVFRSRDQGRSWAAVTRDSAVVHVNALAMKDDYLYAGSSYLAGSNSGVYRIRLTDAVPSWSYVSEGLMPGTGKSDVRTLYVSGTDLYAGTGQFNGNGVYIIYTNANNTNSPVWSRVGNGLPPNVEVLSLAIRGGSLYAGMRGRGVYKLQLSNGMWMPVNTGFTDVGILSVRALEVNGGPLFAGTNGGVYRSNDGTTWQPFYMGMTNYDVYTLRVSGAYLFAGTKEGGVFRLPVSADNWEKANTTIENASVLALAVSGANLFAGALDGVFLSPNQGQSWAPANNGLWGTVVNAFAVTGAGLFAGTSGNDLVGLGGGGVFYLPDNGQSWMARNVGLPPVRSVYSFLAHSSGLFAGTNEGVFLLPNNGQSWMERRTGLGNLRVFALAMIGTDIFAATYAGGVFRSSDQGQNWEKTDRSSSNPLPNLNVTSLAVLNNTTLLAATYGDGVFRSSDQGQNWTPANEGLPSGLKQITALATSGTNIFAGMANVGGVFRSTNQGANWTAVNMGLPPGLAVFSFALSGTNLFAGGALGRGVFVSVNQGESWTSVSSGLPGLLNVNSLAVSGNNNNLFAGTNGGGVFILRF